MRRLLVLSTLLLAACSPSDEDNGQIGGADASVGAGDGEAHGDSAEPDSAEPDSAEPDSAEPDSAEPDSAETTSPKVPAFVGTWYDCSGKVVIDADGGWSQTPYDGPCALSGSWTATDTELTLTPTALGPGNCVVPDYIGRTDGHAVIADRLILTPPAAAARHFGRAGVAERVQYAIETSKATQAWLRLCALPGIGIYHGRYGSLDNNCSFLSCGGAITSWTPQPGGTIHVWTTCSGKCPCAGVLVLTQAADGSLAGAYNAATCDGPDGGTFTAVEVPFGAP